LAWPGFWRRRSDCFRDDRRETITERAGVINLSANGTILLTAMAGFAVSVQTGSLALGFLVGAVIGALVALVGAFSSITLKQSQIAVGFILALLCRDLAYFLGNPFMGLPGERVRFCHPVLKDIPILGKLFFEQDILVYSSFLLIALAYVYVFKTRPA
jgi:simple sugar transport system permease protein